MQELNSCDFENDYDYHCYLEDEKLIRDFYDD